jgi:hypothetical protein
MQPRPAPGFRAIDWLLVYGALFCFLGFSALTPAQNRGVEEPKLRVKEVGPGLFEIGRVRLSKTERTVTIPAEINMREGAVEYFLVTTTGKTHESVLRTDAEPYHIQLAMLLLDAKGRGTNDFPQDKTKPPPGDPIDVEVIWNTKNVQRRARAEEFVFDRAAKGSMRTVKWIYNGSQINAEGFAAQQTGSIISLIDDPDALINNPLPRRDDDDNWQVGTNRVAESGVSVEVIITLPKNRDGKAK